MQELALAAATPISTPVEMTWYAVKVFIALLIIVPLLYWMLRLVGRRAPFSRSMRGNLTIIDALSLGGGKQLLLVRVASRSLLLAVCSNDIRLLWEVPEDIPLQEEKPGGRGGFSELLRRVTDKYGRQQEDRQSGRRNT